MDGLKIIDSLLIACNTEKDLTEVAQTAAAQIRKIFRASETVIMIGFDDSPHSRIFVSSAGQSPPTKKTFCFRWPALPGCACDAMFRAAKKPAGQSTEKQAKPIRISGDYCRNAGYSHVHATPIAIKGKKSPYGFVFAGWKKPLPKSVRAAREMRELAAKLGHAAFRIYERRKMLRRIDGIAALDYAGRLVLSKLTLKEMTREIVNRLGQVFPGDEINVIVYDGTKRELKFLASYFANEDIGQMELASRPKTYPLSDGINSWIIKNRQPLIMRRDTVAECDRMGIRHGGRPAKSWLGVPMIVKDKVVGVISVQSYTKTGQYNADSAKLLEIFASQCAIAVENAKLFELLTRREKEKELLYFTFTHDMISLVNPGIGYARMLRSAVGTQEPLSRPAELANLVIESLAKVVRFADDILVFGKLKSGKLSLSLQTAAYSDILRSAINSCVPSMIFRKLEIRLNGSPLDLDHPVISGLPLVTCDPGQAERVLLNLIGNAVKHARTTIDIGVREGGTGRLLTSVRDDGPGVSADKLPMLCDEYFQADNPKYAGKKSRGFGLGLPSARMIVELHGGKLEFESNPGEYFQAAFDLDISVSS